MREIQLGELSLLKSFIAICSKHDLRYYALGGTLLGAIRHKGFIPWDDDIDLMMSRDNYNRFVKEFTHPRFKVLSLETDKNIIITLLKS